nr:protein translocase subunit SecD [Clostridia bacterium]
MDSVTDEQLQTIQGILENRIEAKGTFDYNMSPDYENKRLLLEIPYASGDDTNPQKVIDDLGEMALLTFQRWDEDKYAFDSSGRIVFLVEEADLKDDNIVLDGTDVADSVAMLNKQDNSYMVALTLTETGAEKFAKATAELVRKPIAIYLDDELKSYPVVSSVISGGEASITGNFTIEEAVELAN